MHEELISKKDLLMETKISYGQLYRWKRKNLIPEEWFIKKSVSTGQETFFPKEKVLDRINKIIDLKDDVSLDELAYKFSGNSKKVSLLRSYIVEHNIVLPVILDKFEEFMGKEEIYNDDRLFSLFIFKELIESDLLSIEEIRDITLAVKRDYSKIDGDLKLIIKRKLGVCFYFVIRDNLEILSENDGKKIYEIDLMKVMDRTKLHGNNY